MKVVVVGLILLASVVVPHAETGYEPMELVDGATDYKPDEGKALVIFVRPSRKATFTSCPIWDLDAEGEHIGFVGVSIRKTYLAYQAEPGEHFFFLATHSGSGLLPRLMKANLEAEKTYYVQVGLDMGMWRSSIVLIPIRKPDPNKGKLKKWFKKSIPIENTNDSFAWAEEEWKIVETKKNQRIQAWENEYSEKTKNQKTLQFGDGI